MASYAIDKALDWISDLINPENTFRTNLLFKYFSNYCIRVEGSLDRDDIAALAQLVRAPDCGSGGPWFETRRWYHFF